MTGEIKEDALEVMKTVTPGARLERLPATHDPQRVFPTLVFGDERLPRLFRVKAQMLEGEDGVRAEHWIVAASYMEEQALYQFTGESGGRAALRKGTNQRGNRRLSEFA